MVSYRETRTLTPVNAAWIAGLLDGEGRSRTIEADGLLATCIQHEIDHLDGVLFIDHLSRLKRERVIKKFIKAAKRDGDA